MPAVRVPQSLPAAGPLSPVAKLRIAAEVLGTFRDVRRRMHHEDVREVLSELRAEGPPGKVPENDPSVVHDALRLGRAVARTLGPLPVDATCLIRSLVVVAMLSRRGLPGTLVIGVQPGRRTPAPSRGPLARRRLARGEAPADGGFAAHAWVEVGGQPVLAPGDFARLTEL